MASVLVANQSVSKTANLCNYLTNEKLNVFGTTNEVSTLEKYSEIKPDIFILNTNLKYIDIIDNLCLDINEKRNCNTLLVSNSPVFISNVSKVYKIFNEPKLQDISDTVEEMCNYTLEREIDKLFLKTKIFRNNNPEYIKDAIIRCYNEPQLLKNMDALFEQMANDKNKNYNTTGDAIRSSFRTALAHANAYKAKKPQFSIFEYFCEDEDITPKAFLEVATNYLKSQK